MGGQVLAPDVDVRVVVDAVAQVRPQRAVAAPDRVVELRRRDGRSRSAGATPRSRPAAAPAIQPSTARQISARWPSASVTPSASRRAARAGVDGVGLDVDERRRRPSPTATSRRPSAAPTTRWVGSASRTSLARIEAGDRPSAVVGRRRECAGVAGRRRAAPRSPRAGAGSTSIGCSATTAARSGRSRAGRRGSRAARVPVPAPYSRRTNGSGRPSRCQASATARASAAPKIGWVSGAVRKSPSRPGRAVGSAVVAAVRVVERELHEPGERHRAVARDLGADPGDERRRPGRPRRGPAAGRGGARASASIGRAAAARRRRAGRPGPTSVWPPSRIGIGAPRPTRSASREPRIGDPVGEEQVRGEAVLGRAASAPRRRRGGGRAGPGCR